MAKGLRPGAKAPDFRLRDGNGKMHRLLNYEGRKVVIYFYPKDDTPGCTLEAIEFNKECKKIQAKGAILLGVSPDNEVSHKKFSEELELVFPLLADPDGLVATKFGAYGEKVLFGTKFNSVYRTTFIIDEEGKVSKVFRDVSVKGHAKEVSKAL
ncbi:MAG: peroxiredoxin [Nitrospinaceae bacterium]|nr:peroxiredoxin [Nitrospinaceae bacterium]MBT3433806.1 peroxiredoxin [Nitrospinaceae bacterium]MBT3822354.1 peroxiredoxin [Nitrospinaceae bacterium]MBT4095456.1 peroxiredoxin [Nitrospinaceae bacterium]MBT4429289.1 peroxiredoxin [Nitrospinaceae bacterium]